MDLYFSAGKRRRGRPRVCLPVALAEDLLAAQIPFRTKADLGNLRTKAADREGWKALVQKIAPPPMK